MSLNNKIPNDDDYERWIIRSLPDKWESKTEPSETLNKYLALLKERHENCIKEMSSEVALINTELETEIRLKSNQLKKELNDLKQTAIDHLPYIEDTDEIFEYDINNFKTSKILCMDVLSEGRKAINSFCCFLRNVEKDRSESFKRIYGLYYKKFLKIAHLTPYELQLFFETHILNTNQVILNNLRGYTELYCDVNVKYENDIKLLLFKIQQAKDDWKTIYKDKIKKLFSQFDINTDDIEEVINNATSIAEIMKIFMDKHEQLTAKLTEGIPFINEELETWYNNIEEILRDLTNGGYDLIETFKTLLDDLITKRHHELEKTNSTISTTIPEIKSFYSDILEPRVRLIKNDIFSEIQTFQEKWNLAIEDALLNLAYIHEFINEYSKILTKHTTRLKQAQKLVNKNLDQVMSENDKQLKGAEINLNVLIDTLRQELNEKKAVKDLKKIEKSLDGISKIISKNHDIELEVISKYFNFIESESGILKAELNQFLSKYSKKNQMHTLTENESHTIVNEKLSPTTELIIKTTNIDDTDFDDNQTTNTPVENLSQITINSFIKHPATRANIIFRRLTDCKVHVLMTYWKETLEESIDHYVKCIAEDQMYHAKQWSLVYVEKIEERYKILNLEHNKRLPRITAEVYDVRISEINLHQARFQSHKLAVDKRLSELEKSLGNFRVNHENMLREKLLEIEERSNKINSINSSVLAQDLIREIESLSRNFSTHLTDSFNKIQENALTTIEEITKSNNKFITSIRLFSESGNFNVKEASALSNKLLLIDNNIKRKTAGIKAMLTSLEKTLKEQITKTPKKNIAVITEVLENIKLQEKSKNIIDKIQEEVKHEVVDMKLKNKRVTVKFEEIKELVMNKSSHDLKYEFKNIHQLVNKTTKYLTEYEHYLLEEDNPPLMSMPVESETELIDRTDAASVKSLKSSRGKKSTTIVKKKTVVNYYEDFFVNKPKEFVNSEQFMPKIRKQMMDSLKQTQESAQKFYEQGIELSPDVPASYDEYMKQFVKKYKNYYLQCGQAWLEEIQGYVRVINDFQLYIRDYCQQTIIDFHDKKMYELEQMQTQIVGEAKKLSRDNLQLIKDNRDKLKPLHGYPNNRKLLDELKQNMEKVFIEATTSFIGFMDYTADLPKYNDNYQIEMEEIKENIRKIEKQVYVDNFINVLLQQGENYIKNFGTHLVKENDGKKVEELLTAFKEATSFKPMETNIFPKLDGDAGLIVMEPNSSITEHPIISTLFDVYQQQLVNDVNDVLDIKKSTELEIQKHEDMWEADVEHVLNLYTVKYK